MCENYRKIYDKLRHYGKEVGKQEYNVDYLSFCCKEYRYNCKRYFVLMVDGYVIGYVDYKTCVLDVLNMWKFQFEDVKRILFRYTDYYKDKMDNTTNPFDLAGYKSCYNVFINILLDLHIYTDYMLTKI